MRCARVRLVGLWMGTVIATSPATARAWSWAEEPPATWAGAPTFRMHEAGSSDLGAELTELVLLRAAGGWSSASCTALRSDYGGRTGAAPRLGDGISEIAWEEHAWPGDPRDVGFTRRVVREGRIVEADILLNGVDYEWVDGAGTPGLVDAYSIVLHELGHAYGLGHSDDASAVMFATYRGGVVELGDDDREGVCALYPGGLPTDCHRIGCATGQVCLADGVCAGTVHDRAVCAPCTAGAECAPGACIGYPDGRSYCGVPCAGPSDCAAGEVCHDLPSVGGRCVRLVEGAPSCAGWVRGCSVDTECGPLETCEVTSGLCVRGLAGAELGARCDAPSDCLSGRCIAHACARSCDLLGSAEACGPGFGCTDRADGACFGLGFCRAGSGGDAGPRCEPVGDVGAPCVDASTCVGALCASDGAGAYCTRPCESSTDCPPGMACGATSDGSFACLLPRAAGCSLAPTAGHFGPLGWLATAGALLWAARVRARRAGARHPVAAR